jgi:hypothetical protein
MIYVNGDSYSRSNGKNYGDYLSEMYTQPLMHKGIPGSSNNRIFRTTTRDILKLKNQNVTDVKVVIGLTFIYRTELWIEDHGIEKWTQFKFDDGEFASFQAATDSNWFTAGVVDDQSTPVEYKNYLKEWIMSNPADGLVINTIYQASLLKNLCENLGYKFIVFWAADSTEDTSRIDPEMDAVKEFSNEFNETNSIDLFNFSFVKDYFDIGYKPYDFDVYGKHGHPDTNVHDIFSKRLYNIFEGIQ